MWPEVGEGERIIVRAEVKAEFDTDLGKVRCPHNNNAHQSFETAIDIRNNKHISIKCYVNDWR